MAIMRPRFSRPYTPHVRRWANLILLFLFLKTLVNHIQIWAMLSKNLFLENIRLASDLARRDLNARYRRSILSGLWLVLTPLCFLGIYSLVFGVIFKVTWKMPGGDGGNIGFALPFFVGLSIYLTFSDVITSSSSLLASKRTYVVKSPFPLWVLWLSNMMRAGIHAGVSLILVLILAIIQQRLTIEGFFYMLICLVCCAAFLGALSLLLTALGPFIGDISEATRLIMRVMFYATPISYPLDMLPEHIRHWVWLNPLATMVEITREAIVFGKLADGQIIATFFAASLLLFALSYWVFKRVKGYVSDVV